MSRARIATSSALDIRRVRGAPGLKMTGAELVELYAQLCKDSPMITTGIPSTRKLGRLGRSSLRRLVDPRRSRGTT